MWQKAKGLSADQRTRSLVLEIVWETRSLEGTLAKFLGKQMEKKTSSFCSALDQEFGNLSIYAVSATSLLCDLGQVISFSLWASFSL